MGNHYNIAILGAGPGGYVAALKAGQLGASVAVVEQSHLGGTCLNNGCIPSKALLASAELIHHISHAAELGVKVDGHPAVDWPKVQARKDTVLKNLRGGIKSLFKGRKVVHYDGRAVLNGPGKVAIQKDGKAAQEITADKIIIAVGSVPTRIPGWPDDPQKVCTSDEALHWDELPKRLLIVGGGIIGCEFACMMQPFGVEVTVVEMLPALLPTLDTHLGAELEKTLAARGIKCFTNTKVESLDTDGEGVTARLSGGQEVAADKVLVAIGRSANTDDIGLDSLGLTTDRRFVRVNDRMETGAKDVYCIGDCNGRSLLAHAASQQGIVAAENALGHDRVDDAPIPGAVYTFPEIGSVGLSEQQARERNIPIAIGSFPIGYLGKAMAVGDTQGFVKIIRERSSGKLLGVHMLGHNATECIAAAGAMLHCKASVAEVAEVVFAHPTISEAIKEAAEDALGMALHLPPRKLLRVATK